MASDVGQRKLTAGWQESAPEIIPASNPSGICSQEQVNRGRLGVEFLLYFSIACRVFGQQLGVLSVPGLSGAIILVSGFISFFIVLARREPFPMSFVFALIISCMASVTDLALSGVVQKDMLFWMSTLLMACYIARDHRAVLRFECFLALVVLMSVIMGGAYIGQAKGYARLALKEDVVGSMFANSNALAQVAYMAATALLLSSLEYRATVKILCLVLALALSAVVLLTLSRQGLFMLLIGVFFFLIASALKFRRNTGFILFIALAVVGTFLYGNELAKIISGYEHRLSLDSDRIAFWSTAPQDMLETFYSGRGSFNAFSSVGIVPHNTFLWLHLAYGGFCALVYLGWLLWLGYKSMVTVTSNLDNLAKISVLALFTMFFLGQLTTIFAPGNYGYILGIALLESSFIRSGRMKVPEASCKNPEARYVGLRS